MDPDSNPSSSPPLLPVAPLDPLPSTDLEKHKCPMCGFVSIFCPESVFDDEIDNADLSLFDMGQREEDVEEMGRVPDTEEPFDLGPDFSFPKSPPATTPVSLPLPVKPRGLNAYAGVVAAAGDVAEMGWVPDTEEPFNLGLDFSFLKSPPATTPVSLPLPVKPRGLDGGVVVVVEGDGVKPSSSLFRGYQNASSPP